MKSHKVELLAPAGNYDSFIGAINAGADAVYVGGDKFSARAYAVSTLTFLLFTRLLHSKINLFTSFSGTKSKSLFLSRMDKSKYTFISYRDWLHVSV